MPRNYRKEYLAYYGESYEKANELQRLHRRHKDNRNKARSMIASAFGIPAVRLRGDVDHLDGDPLNSTYDNLLLTSVRSNRGIFNVIRNKTNI